MVLTKKELQWKQTHLKNLIKSANDPNSLFKKSDGPRFRKQLKVVKEKLRRMKK